MTKGVSPLFGYNTNVRHKGHVYHIQTEDSGVRHPHIITHLFADGGRIIATRKTSYAEHLGDEDLRARVKSLMQAQHKAMFIALRDGVYDDDGPALTAEVFAAEPATSDDAATPTEAAHADAEALDVSAALAKNYHPTQPVLTPRSERPSDSIFGSDLLAEKSLDEVILSYLAEDLEEGGRN